MNDEKLQTTGWLKRAAEFSALAANASAAGNHVVMIVSLQRAAECVQIAKALAEMERT